MQSLLTKSNNLPGLEAVQAAAVRVEESAQFKVAPRLASFLRFVVDESLAGRSASIKAYTIAIGALGRPDSFDPATDAIVRVEAGRLRAALKRYYNGEGASDPVVIAIPRGGYVPEFGWRDAAVRDARPSAKAQVEAVFQEREGQLTTIRKNMADMRARVSEFRLCLGDSQTIMARSALLLDKTRNTREAVDCCAAVAGGGAAPPSRRDIIPSLNATGLASTG